MGNYKGYVVKIEGVPFDAKLMVQNSYSCVRARVISGSWRDADGDMHYSFYPHKKTTINFTIVRRTESQNEEIRHFFAKLDNVSVEYWDDIEKAYKTGIFKMDDVTFKHQYDANDAPYYAQTPIKLVEY